MTPWVGRLLIATVVVFVFTSMNPVIKNYLAFNPYWTIVQPWRVYTVFTYMFVHAGFGHIFWNMLILYMLGPRVEAQLGGRRFLNLYILSGLGGALLTVVTPLASIIGASGAIFGVLLAYGRFWPRHKLLLMFVLPVEIRWLIIGYTVYSLWAGLARVQQGIAHFAHLGGFLGAWLYLKWLDHNAPSKKFQRKMYANVPKGAAQEMNAARRWQNIRRDTLHEVNRDEVERLLAKLEQAGVTSLTLDERAFLDRFATPQ